MDKLTGVIEMEEHRIPFFMNGFVFDFTTLDIVPLQHWLPVDKINTAEGFVTGRTHGGYFIAVYTGQDSFRTNATSSVHTCMYITSKNNASNVWCGEPFDGMLFCGGCIDKVYQGRALVPQEDIFVGDKITLLRNNDTVEFDFPEGENSVHAMFSTNVNISQSFDNGLSVKEDGKFLRLLFDSPQTLGNVPKIIDNVTLVATGTDVKPLEVVLFMNDVKSEILYTQMKGRGCRSLNDDKLKEVTPNATTKECFYIVDAVGVTEHDKTIPKPGGEGNGKKQLSLEHLLEHLAHNELSDDNLALLRDYCATIHKRYEFNVLFGKHLVAFISDYGFAPKALANDINEALENNTLPPYVSPSQDNPERMALISCLISNIPARKKLLELQKGYYAVAEETPDEILYSGFSKETARSFVDSFEKYLNDNKDSIEALRIIYNSEDTAITYTMLCDLQDKLLSENRLFTPFFIWRNYKLLDMDGSVEELDVKQNVKALTHLIQLVRYAFGKTANLTSLFGSFAQRFSLYCGQVQRSLTDDQITVMRQIAEYVVSEGSFTLMELNGFDTELWKKGISSFGANVLAAEMQTLSKFILKVA